jgi:hypothetical protein
MRIEHSKEANGIHYVYCLYINLPRSLSKVSLLSRTRLQVQILNKSLLRASRIPKEAFPQIITLDQLSTTRSSSQQLIQRCLLQLIRIGRLDFLLDCICVGRLDFAVGGPVEMGHSSSNRNVVDGFFNSVTDQIHPYGGLEALSDSMNSGNGLKLDGCIDQGLAEDYMCCFNQVEAGRMGSGMEHEAFDL